jgi:hypothetical protein
MCAIYYTQKDVDGHCQKGEYNKYVEESKDQTDARARVESNSTFLGICYLRKFLIKVQAICLWVGGLERNTFDPIKYLNWLVSKLRSFG